MSENRLTDGQRDELRAAIRHAKAIGWSLEGLAKHCGLKQSSSISNLIAAGSTRGTSPRTLACLLEAARVPPQEGAGKRQRRSTEGVTSSDRFTADTPFLTEQERKAMNDPRGRAVIGLMGGFTEGQLRKLLKAAMAIEGEGDVGGQSKTKEGVHSRLVR